MLKLKQQSEHSKITANNGFEFSPLDFYNDNVHIDDFEEFLRVFAAPLSLQCRFAGHCKEFYSVLDHVMGGFEYFKDSPEEILLWGLHDITEGILLDVPRPYKNTLYIDLKGSGSSTVDVESLLYKHFDFVLFKDFEEEVFHNILQELKLNSIYSNKIWQKVIEIDNEMLRREREVLKKFDDNSSIKDFVPYNNLEFSKTLDNYIKIMLEAYNKIESEY
jgi:hypothetical protein